MLHTFECLHPSFSNTIWHCSIASSFFSDNFISLTLSPHSASHSPQSGNMYTTYAFMFETLMSCVQWKVPQTNKSYTKSHHLAWHLILLICRQAPCLWGNEDRKNSKTIVSPSFFRANCTIHTQTYILHMHLCVQIQCPCESITTNDWRRVALVHNNSLWVLTSSLSFRPQMTHPHALPLIPEVELQWCERHNELHSCTLFLGATKSRNFISYVLFFCFYRRQCWYVMLISTPCVASPPLTHAFSSVY